MSIPVYILKRILQAIPLLLLVSVISFVIIRLSPVDPLAELKLNPVISTQTLLAEKERLGLDLPLYQQYFKWLFNAAQGNLGISVSGEQVIDRLMERIPNTILLTTTTILVTWLFGIPLGCYPAKNWQKHPDRIITIFSSIGMAIPK